MSRTVFYCRCGERLVGARARIDHRCPARNDPRPIPGISRRGDELHIDVPEFLAYIGWEDTLANREQAVKLVREAAEVEFPGVPLVEQ